MSASGGRVQVEVTSRGEVGEFAAEYARSKLSRALDVAGPSVQGAHAVLEWRPNPSTTAHAVAEVSAGLGGRVVRAKAAAPTMPEAVDALEQRLRRRVVQLLDRRKDRHRWTGVAGSGPDRHRLDHDEVPTLPRPVAAREVVRRKSFASTTMTADEAAYEMDLLDHDFFLFRDAGSGRPALVHRLPSGGFGVQGLEPDQRVTSLAYEPAPPSLSDLAARVRLEADGEPYVFYLDEATGQGRVLYHRYDGHYGLIQLGA